MAPSADDDALQRKDTPNLVLKLLRRAEALSAFENLELHAPIERVACIVLSRSDEGLFWADARRDQPFGKTRLIPLQKLLDRLRS
jgi:hypothetical protein